MSAWVLILWIFVKGSFHFVFRAAAARNMLVRFSANYLGISSIILHHLLLAENPLLSWNVFSISFDLGWAFCDGSSWCSSSEQEHKMHHCSRYRLNYSFMWWVGLMTNVNQWRRTNINFLIIFRILLFKLFWACFSTTFAALDAVRGHFWSAGRVFIRPEYFEVWFHDISCTQDS